MMPYRVNAVANAIIQKARANGENVTPLKLQKLLYYVCGYYAAAYSNPVVDHTFEAWDYGPVVPSIYREFKHYGNQPITGLATDIDFESGIRIPTPPPDGDKGFDAVLDFVWKSYGKFTAAQLSAMTHAPGSPWEKVRKENPGIKDADIGTKALIEHFSKFITRKEAA